MMRDCDLDEISDGKKYTLTDMVKADCDGCKGCSDCCHGMGNSIVLDPLDFYRISNRLGLCFEALLGDRIELNIVDGVILPNLKMSDSADESCVFLNPEGRCDIHSDRPGICRIFPLGRLYEEGSFSYILQTHECKKPNRAKVKVSKWIDTPDIGQNQRFVRDWHYFLKDVQAELFRRGEDSYIKKSTMQILQCFYVEPYARETDFYRQFYKRLEQLRKMIFG
ncbi:MAG: YkgJ family cysteine cluster protein [Roseburia sp.]|nr:YkgJ family cysteine cluster protein [Roseburia sp.]